MAVASNEGAYLWSVVSVRPVNGGRNPFRSAFLSVDMAGENNAACANATRSAGVLALRLIAGAALFLLSVAGGAGGGMSWRLANMAGGTTHNPSALRGRRISLPVGRVMVHWLFVKVTSQPWSQRGASANRLLFKSGKHGPVVLHGVVRGWVIRPCVLSAYIVGLPLGLAGGLRLL